jgi:hypothetical protein
MMFAQRKCLAEYRYAVAVAVSWKKKKHEIKLNREIDGAGISVVQQRCYRQGEYNENRVKTQTLCVQRKMEDACSLVQNEK